MIGRMLATLLAAGTAIPAQAQDSAQAGQPEARVLVGEDYGQAPDTGLMRPAQLAGRPGSYLATSVADYPEAAIRAKQRGLARVEVQVAADDKVTSCKVTENTAGELLGAGACAIARRGRYRHALTLDGRPIASSLDVLIEWRLTDPSERTISPAPPPPASPTSPMNRWPITRAQTGLAISKAPDWKRFAPAGKPSGEVVVGVVLAADMTVRECRIWHSSGDAGLDAATCDAAKTGSYRAPEPYFPAVVPIRVAWKQGKARHQLPVRPYRQMVRIPGVPLALPTTIATPPLPAGPFEREFAIVRLEIGADGGQRSCRVFVSTGADDADRALCMHATKTLRFTPAIDVFGENTADTISIRFDLKD